MKPSIGVFLIDDHPLLRRGLAALVEQQADLYIAGEAGDASEALRLLPAAKPDVILLDNHLPGVRGVNAIADLLAAAPGSRILMLTVSEESEDLTAALRAGAQGYLLKTTSDRVLVEAIRRAIQDKPFISPELTSKLVSAFQSQGDQDLPAPEASSAVSPLSPRQEEVLREIARGASNKEIARTLDIAEDTVKVHVRHILRKLKLNSRVQAAVYATERDKNA